MCPLVLVFHSSSLSWTSVTKESMTDFTESTFFQLSGPLSFCEHHCYLWTRGPCRSISVPNHFLMAMRKVTSSFKNSMWWDNIFTSRLLKRNRAVMIERRWLCSIKRIHSVTFSTSGEPLGESIFTHQWPQLRENRGIRGNGLLNFSNTTGSVLFYPILLSKLNMVVQML